MLSFTSNLLQAMLCQLSLSNYVCPQYQPSDLTPDSSYQNIQQLNPLQKYLDKSQSFLIWCWQVREVRKSTAWHGRTPSQPLRDCLQYSVYSVYSEPGTEWGAAQVLTTIPTPGHSPVSSVDTTVWSWDVMWPTVPWHDILIKSRWNPEQRWSFKNNFFFIPK